MSVAEAVQTTAKASSSTTSGLLLQRKCACGGSASFSGECEACKSNKLLGKPLQRKLAINEPGDEYEQEADRVADQVMRMSDVPVNRDAPHSSPAPLVQRRVNGSGPAGIGAAPQIVHDVLSSPGQPLDAATRAFFEPRFGHNLAHVRVHADGRAQLAAESVQARAFTVGSHIVFGAGEYAPKSIASRQVLAHELTHTLQQTGSGVPSSNASSPGSIPNTISPTHSDPVIARKASPAFPQSDHIANQSVAPSAVRPSAVASTAGLDQSAVAVAEEVIGAQVDALFREQPETGTDEPARLATTLTHDRREDKDEDEKKALEEIKSIQATSTLPGEVEEADQPDEAVAELQGVAFGPEPSLMASGPTSEPVPASTAPAMPVTSPSEAGRWFNALPPSVQAENYAQLGVALSGSFMNQAVETQEDIPELSASLEGVSELPAIPDIVTPPQTPSIAAHALANAPEPLVNIPQAPVQQPVGTSALPTAQAAEPKALEQALGTIDQGPAIVTTLETPEIPLEGKADPAALDELESAAAGEATLALETANTGVMEVTPETVQPLALDEIVGAPALLEVSVPEQTSQIEGMDKLAGYALSPQDRAIVDAQMGPSMQEATGGAQSELDQHEQAFDQERIRLQLEADAETEVAQAKAEEGQSLEVERVRQDLALEQERTLEQQQAAVDGALDQLATSRESSRQAIDDRFAEDRAVVDEAYAAAKVNAEAKVEEGKVDADAVKGTTADQVQASSWWDWAIDTWQALVQKVASAVIAIGQKIVTAVAGIFDEAIAFATQVVNGTVAFVKGALSAYYDFWIGLVDTLLGNIFPELAAAFRTAVESLKAKVFEALDALAAAYLQTLRVLADTLVAGLNAGLETYKAGVAAYVALWEAIQTGQWAEVGKTLLTAILTAAGIDPAEFFGTFGKVDEVLDDVIADPGVVGRNAVEALALGFTQFGKHFIGNFVVAFVEWITGSARIRLPTTFGMAGIFQVVCDVLNLTKEYLRKKAVQHLGEGAVTAVEELTELAWGFVSGGWANLWDLVKDKLITLVDDVVIATGTWLVEKAILVAGRWIAGLAATMGLSVILEALIALWQFVMWLKDQFQRFWMIVKSTVDSVHDFVKGNIKPAAATIEGTLQDLIVPAIDLVAKLLNISNIAKKVEQIIESVRNVIDGAIDGVIAWLKKKLKAGVKTVKQKAKEVAGKLLNWWNARSDFKDESGEPHTLFYKGEGRSAELYVASESELVETFLNEAEKVAATKESARTAKEQYIEIKKDEMQLLDEKDDLIRQKTVDALQKKLNSFGEYLRPLFIAENAMFPPPVLPVMAGGVKAMDFTADYLCKNAECKYRVGKPDDNEAMFKGSKPKDFPIGYKALQDMRYTNQSESPVKSGSGSRDWYVAMHLLPDSLGGQGSSSNLTPALHSINVASSKSFHHKIEKTAEQAAKLKPIWYTFEIKYYSSAKEPAGWVGPYEANAYPSRLYAEWGHYDMDDQRKIKQGKPGKIKQGEAEEQPRPPGNEKLTEEEIAAAGKVATVQNYADFMETVAAWLRGLASPIPLMLAAEVVPIVRDLAKEGDSQKAAEITSLFILDLGREFYSEGGHLSGMVQEILKWMEETTSTLVPRLDKLNERAQAMLDETNGVNSTYNEILKKYQDQDDGHLQNLNTIKSHKFHEQANTFVKNLVLSSRRQSHAVMLQDKMNAVFLATQALSQEEAKIGPLEAAVKAANEVFSLIRDFIPKTEDEIEKQELKLDKYYEYYEKARIFLKGKNEKQEEAERSVTPEAATSSSEK